MFCSKCGQQIPDNSTFCSACGNQVSGSSNVAVSTPAPTTNYDYNAQMQVQFQMQKNAVRQSEMQSLNNAIQYFFQKKAQFDEFDAVSELVNYYSRGAKSGLIVWGAIIASFGLVFLAGAGSIGFSELMMGIVMFLVPGSAMIFGGILMKKNNRRKFAYYQQRYAELSQELYDYYARYPDCPVGPEYVNPDILCVIMDVLESGRADTVKESLNLLLQEISDDEYREYLESINANTNAIAFFAAASFFR